MIKLLVFLILSPIGAIAKPQLSKSFRPWWTESLLQYETYHSIGNFNSNGSLESLPSANSFWETSNIEYSGRYVFNPNWAMTAGINYVQAQANIGNTAKYNGGMQSFNGGVEYRVDSNLADFILEGVGHFSMLSVDNSSIKPIYGDGAHSFGGNLWIIKKFANVQWYGKGGFLYRTEGLSSLIPYQLGVNWRLGSWVLGSNIDGFMSAGQDTESETYRTAFLNRSSIGSLNYRSANPRSNFLDFQAKLNVTSQFSFTGGIGSTFFGKSSSDGTHYYVGLDIQWQVYQQPVEHTPFKNMINKPPKPSNKDEKGPLFQEEDYNRELEEQKTNDY